jgi:hypothetical protein
MLHVNLSAFLSGMGFRLIFLGAVLVVAEHAQTAPVLASMSGWPITREWGGQMQHDQFNLEGEEQFAKWSNKEIVIEARSKGRIEFTDDDRDIKSISRNGYFKLRDERDGLGRSLEVVSGSDGTLQKSYTVRGERREFDAEASAWLAKLLPEVIRHTVMGAEARVQRILRQGGAGKVLDEISLIEPNSAKLIYLRHLFKGKLAADDLQRAAQLVARNISSDGDKARFLVESRDTFLANDAAAPSFFDAINSIKSDGDRGRVLTAAVKKDGLGRELLLLALESAKRFSSDGDKGRFLAEAAPHYLGNDELAIAFFDAVSSIRADGDHRRVLSLSLGQRPVRHENIVLAVKSARRIMSDGDKAGFLLEVVAMNLKDSMVTTAVREAASGIGSEGDRMRVLAALSQE